MWLRHRRNDWGCLCSRLPPTAGSIGPDACLCEANYWKNPVSMSCQRCPANAASPAASARQSDCTCLANSYRNFTGIGLCSLGCR